MGTTFRSFVYVLPVLWWYGLADLIVLTTRPAREGSFFQVASSGSEYRALSLTGELCFVPGTPVLTFHGLRAIGTVQENDLVWSRDPTTGEEGWQPVVQLFRTHPTELHHLTYDVANFASQPALTSTGPRGPPGKRTTR